MELGVLQDVLKRFWGFDGFLPLQRQAMDCVLEDRDSLVVMPTGGGKSLCYQAPAICREGVAIVVSPLIALMKDQVDALTSCGIPAAAVNSTMTADERRQVVKRIESGELRLLYASPERLLNPRTLEFLENQQVTFIAVDEAHCISAWGHDFRPEYRDLRILRDRFPGVALHAYTATATLPVRADIIEQLGLRNPQTLVGDFHRPNLRYFVQHRQSGLSQICSVIDRFRGQSGIVYCITRAEVEKTAKSLQQLGYAARPYHAGMPDKDRTRNQDAFLVEETDIIVATIAFGMGIDKSNVRFVVHAGMPKSLENYQQESGRAGRDGVEAECWLLNSARDLMTWKRVLSDLEGPARATADSALERIYSYCSSVSCRHASLIEHFGQAWEKSSCDACDVCLGKLEVVDDPVVIGQKILSCVLRVNERYGADYISMVLNGSKDQRIVANRHDQLSTWGLLEEFRRQDVRQWIEQLVNQDFLAKEAEYHVLSVTPKGRQLLRGELAPTLLRPSSPHSRQSHSARDSWDGVDRALFEKLRKLRRQEAVARGVPAYIVFSDATLRDMARRRPSTIARFQDVHGVGRQKSADFGSSFVEVIAAHCRGANVDADAAVDVVEESVKPVTPETPSTNALQSFALFDEGLDVPEIAQRLQRAISTTYQYLEAYIQFRQLTDPSRWLSADDFNRIRSAAEHTGTLRLKPIHEALQGEIDYPKIRIAVACLRNHPLASR